MTDGEIMVYLRNIALAVSKIAKEKQETVDIRSTEESTHVRIGDYEYSLLDEIGKEHYYYRPYGKVFDWEEVEPGQICFKGKLGEAEEKNA